MELELDKQTVSYTVDLLQKCNIEKQYEAAIFVLL